MKKDNTIYWIVGIVVLFLVLTQTSIFKKQDTGMIGLNPHYYKDGVEIFPERGFFGFTIVTPPGGSYDQIAFSISATNTGPPIDLQIVDASPIGFKSALPTTVQSLAIGQTKTLWTSDLMDTEQFEAVSPVNFWIKISGEHPDFGTTYVEGYSGDISFVAESIPGGSQRVFLFSIVSPDPTQYDLTFYSDAYYHDLHKYGTVTTSSYLSSLVGFIATGDMIYPVGSYYMIYRFKFVGDNTGDVYYSSEFTPRPVGGGFETHSWREDIPGMLGDTSYSVILQAKYSSSTYTKTASVKNMNIGVLYLQ